MALCSKTVMTDQKLTFVTKCECEQPLADVIFIHGLTGHAEATWSSGDESEFWPEWLWEDRRDFSIHTIGYPSEVFVSWAKKETDLFERAASILDLLAAKGIGKRPVVFVAHSLGGLLAKAIIRKSCESDDKDWKGVSTSCCLIVFLGTPHHGSSLASALKAAVPRLSSTLVSTLSGGLGLLDDLNQSFRSYANGKPNLETAVYYETIKTKKLAIVVDKASADPGVKGAHPVAVDKDHAGLCKPSNRDEPVYLGIKRRLDAVLEDSWAKVDAGAAFATEDYSSPSEDDRRDLHQKLLAANREHEYTRANNMQSKFARQYLSLGLFTKARELNDKVLADVEQRFIMHVYHPLVCKGATESQIQHAIQESVIDPVCKKYESIKDFRSENVVQAMYFLAEQCHIRWDPAK